MTTTDDLDVTVKDHTQTRASILCNGGTPAHCLSLCVVSQLLDPYHNSIFKLLRPLKLHFKDPDLIHWSGDGCTGFFILNPR